MSIELRDRWEALTNPRVLGALARALVSAGILVLLFAAYGLALRLHFLGTR